MIQKYLNEVFKKYKTCEAVERSYYPLLENFLKEFKDSQIIIEAKSSTVGIPEFKVETPKGLLLGYIEAKDVGRDLDKLSKDENAQIERYLKEYPKLIVTNFIEFRLYENKEIIDTVLISQPDTLQLGIPALDNEGRLVGLLERFFKTTIPQIYTSRRLAELLAIKTRVLKNLIIEEINSDDGVTTSTEELYASFKKTLRPDMSADEFADMYAQTVTFGLFTARVNSNGSDFSRKTAYDFIPPTIALLRKLFWIISGTDVPQYVRWQVDEIAEILANTNIQKIKEDFFAQGKGRDPIIHFYETFLTVYDSKERARRGVYYTPPAVVSYITRSIHELLKTKFNKADGFADTSVLVLDPATGTLTFPIEAIILAKEEYTKKYGDGGWESLVKNHLLEHFFAFELLMAPYSIGHLKVSLLLQELGYKLKDDDRFKLFLTNTLEMDKVQEQELFLAKEITEESNQAYEVKHNDKILVIMGNPPYSVSSSNIIKKGTGFYDLYESYKEVVRKEEKNIQPLSDDYIKFIAFAHWKIKKAGQGIVGMITNNSYLDGLIHRDMRRKLLDDFDEIYILNMHGSSTRNVKIASDLTITDENIFDIKQGVSIVLFVKNGNSANRSVYHSEVIGGRQTKTDYLENHSITNSNWKKLDIDNFNKRFLTTMWATRYSTGFYFFTPKASDNIVNYGNYFGLTDIFIHRSCGVKTSNDDYLIGFNESGLESGLVSQKINFTRDNFRKYSYRPFDERIIYWDPKYISRSRLPLSGSMLSDNLSICVSKNTVIEDMYSPVLISNSLSDLKYCEYSRGCYFFPLFNYGQKTTLQLFDSEQEKLQLEGTQNTLRGNSNRTVNFSDSFTKHIRQDLPFVSDLEKVFYYIYAILYSNIYREKYKEFLKIDFPRIPFTKDIDLFNKLAEWGELLASLHLLKSDRLTNTIAKFQGEGNGLVEKREFKNGRAYINDKQYFEGVDEDVWNYYIGGYQVLDKWLKDRKGRYLSSDEVKTYCQIVTALSETIKIQKEIDNLYLEVEKSLIKD